MVAATQGMQPTGLAGHREHELPERIAPAGIALTKAAGELLICPFCVVMWVAVPAARIGSAGRASAQSRTGPGAG